MSDYIKTKVLKEVIVQENGIIRNKKVYLIGYLVDDVDFNSEHLETGKNADIEDE